MTASKWEYFSEEELQCPCCKQNKMDDQFMQRIVTLRKMMGIPFKVTSAYRCPAYNNTISKSGLDGPHTTGRAMDFLMMGDDVLDVIVKAVALGFTGFGLNQKGDESSRYIHLDMLSSAPRRPRPWVWTY